MSQVLLAGAVLSAVFLVLSNGRSSRSSVSRAVFLTAAVVIALVLILRMFPSFLQGIL